MVLDIGEIEIRTERYTGSAYATCDEAPKKNIMPKLPKNIEIVFVSDNGNIQDKWPR